LGGDRELAKAIIQSATEDIPGYFEQLEQAVAAGNWKTAERQTHTMKGLTAQIGGIKLSVRMKALDDHLKGGGDTDSATVAALRNDYQLLSDILVRWMASPPATTQEPAETRFDADRIAAIYRELDALLSQNNFDAMGLFKDLQQSVAGTEVSAKVAEAGRMMTEFRFDLARGHLHRIAAQQGWETKAS
jgi:HPt (histidine-containing phosphotransfer) domain-containing protein